MSALVLGVSGSVSVYKACDLASQLTQAGHAVRTVMTRRAAELVSPQLFEAVTGEVPYVDEFGEDRRGAMDHIELARTAELFLVAPMTGDLAAMLALVAYAAADGGPRIYQGAISVPGLGDLEVAMSVAGTSDEPLLLMSVPAQGLEDMPLQTRVMQPSSAVAQRRRRKPGKQQKRRPIPLRPI